MFKYKRQNGDITVELLNAISRQRQFETSLQMTRG